jgi:uncharacterized protein (TIGR02646 family)
MLYIKKGNPPNNLIQYIKIGGKWKISDSSVRNELRESLLEEQNHLCAFCMSRIKFRGSQIEHWFPRSLSIDNLEFKKLDYNNLFLVCEDNNKSCDTTRTERKELSVNPTSARTIDNIYYEKASGRIRSRSEIEEQDLNIELNLNGTKKFKNTKEKFDLHIENRKKLLYEFRKTLDAMEKSGKKVDLKKLLANYMNPVNGQLIPYCGIVIWYIKSKIKTS